MAKGPAVITGGLVLAATGRVAPSDLLLEDDRIAAIAPPGSVTSASARRIDAADRLIIPGLINAHTHGHGGLAKGSGDRWSLGTAAECRPLDQRRPHRRRPLSFDAARRGRDAAQRLHRLLRPVGDAAGADRWRDCTASRRPMPMSACAR